MSAVTKAATLTFACMAPAAPKEPRQKCEKTKKGDGENGKLDKGALAAAPWAASSALAAAAPAVGIGGFASMHEGMATQVLKWQLLQYHLQLRTTLGEVGETVNTGKPRMVKGTADGGTEPSSRLKRLSQRSPHAEGSPESALEKLDIRCGHILSCQRVSQADALFLLKVDVGEQQPRQVVSNLCMHYEEEEMRDRKALVYCNIKPSKKRGYDSNAMLLNATKDEGGANEQKELLEPPAGAQVGERPVCGDLQVGSTSGELSTRNISKSWDKVRPLLQTDHSKGATFKGVPLTFSGQRICCASLAEVGIY